MRLRDGEYEVRLIDTVSGHTRSKKRVFASTALEAEMIALAHWRAHHWNVENSYATAHYQREAK